MLPAQKIMALRKCSNHTVYPNVLQLLQKLYAICNELDRNKLIQVFVYILKTLTKIKINISEKVRLKKCFSQFPGVVGGKDAICFQSSIKNNEIQFPFTF